MTIDLQSLLEEAKAKFNRLPVDMKDHICHEQRISFAVGNVSLSHDDSTTPFSQKDIEKIVRRVAGSCSCGTCRDDIGRWESEGGAL